jgi:hypothetical protein
MHKDTLEKYQDAVMGVVHANNDTLLREDRMDDNQKAGTALLMAAAQVGFAAGLLAKTDPRLKNATVDAQIDDALSLLREAMIRKTPNISLVSERDQADDR